MNNTIMNAISQSKRIIEVLDYDLKWPFFFEEERHSLEAVLGSVALKVHHIGSTSVPGLAAKPVIDILIEVTRLEALDALNGSMQGLGYEPRGELGIPGRRYYSKGGNARTHQVHAFIGGDPHIHRHLAFREYLRNHPDVANEYARLKKEVAASCNHDIVRYMDGKDAWIKAALAKALKAVEVTHGSGA